MAALTLDMANQIVCGAIKHAREIDAAPICVAVLDNRGIVRALQTEDGCALLRPDIAQGKARGKFGAVTMSRAIHDHTRFEISGYGLTLASFRMPIA